ncbi:MAG TPA: TetR/AcrR family transcriptional regulator [Mycobacterium sp.]|jgi:AcrR family transcriptional regulator|nr:TetR/AcrR family transcriptional regulator [Mycobacterium sp.]
MVNQPTGTRKDKTRRTRQLIEECAVALFAEGAYDDVTMVEIARRANVSPATVFNHFATKDALIFNGLERFERGLLDALCHRALQESIPQAFRTLVLTMSGSLTSAAPEQMRRLRTVAEIIESSPALLSREQQIYGRYTDLLATLIVEQAAARGDELQAWVIANALMGVHRALVRHVRNALLADTPPTQIVREVRRQASVAFAQLDRGLAGYGRREAGR